MARNKEYELYDVERVIDTILLQKGDYVEKIKYVEIENHAAELNLKIKRRSIARDHNVKLLLDEKLKAYNAHNDCIADGIVGYTTLDIDSFFRLSEKQQRKTLAERDQLWEKTAFAAAKVYSDNKNNIKRENILKNENKSLTAERDELTDKLKVINRDLKKIMTENTYFRRVLKSLYPEVADAILNEKESRTKGLLTNNSIAEMVESDIPESFTESVIKDKEFIVNAEIQNMWRKIEEDEE